MVNYETLMLGRTEITNDELSALERQLDKTIAAKKGRITLFDKWGKYKLSYPVKKNMYGIYVLMRFEAPRQEIKSLFDDIESLFRIKYNEIIMRHTTVKLPDQVSSIYKYPEPIGSHGTSNLDSFLKENKMEGLIETPVEKEKTKSEVKEESVEEVEKIAEQTTSEGE